MNRNIFKLLEYASIIISLLLIIFFSKTNNLINMNSKFESPGINLEFMDTSISPIILFNSKKIIKIASVKELLPFFFVESKLKK